MRTLNSFYEQYNFFLYLKFENRLYTNLIKKNKKLFNFKPTCFHLYYSFNSFEINIRNLKYRNS